jgi:hypothetical protein
MYACSLIGECTLTTISARAKLNDIRCDTHSDRTNLPNARVTGMDRELGTNIGNRLVVFSFFRFLE